MSHLTPTGRLPLLLASPFVFVLLLPHLAAGQVQYPAPLYGAGDPMVNTGVPPTNAVMPHANYLAPGVGRVVALSHGFQTPQFGYSYMHPLAAYTHPLTQSGGFGTLASSPYAGTHSVTHVYHHGTTLAPTYAPNLYGNGAGSGLTPAQQQTDPVRNVQYVANPWHSVAQQAIFWPHLGYYGHFASDDGHTGMFVTGVALNSLGHKIGLAPGDVIESIGATKIDSAHTYMKAVRDAEGDVPVKVWNSHSRRGSELTLNFDQAGQVQPAAAAGNAPSGAPASGAP